MWNLKIYLWNSLQNMYIERYVLHTRWTFHPICKMKCIIGLSKVNWNKKHLFNTLRPRQNGRHFPDDIFKCIFVNENIWIPIRISLKFVPNGPINNIPALIQIVAWHRWGAKPLSEPMMVSLLMHICVTQPQWFKIWETRNCMLVIRST